MTSIGMVPGESVKQIPCTSQCDCPDAYSRVLGVPEVLLPILRYVLIGERTKANILKIAGVSHLWREVVCEILKSSGTPVHEFKCDKKPLTNWDKFETNYPTSYDRPVSLQSVNNDNILEHGVAESSMEFFERAIKLPDWETYSVQENIPLGYLLPVGLQIADFKLHQSDIQQFFIRHSEQIVKLKLIIIPSDSKLLKILETLELDNLHALELDFPNCKRIWPGDIIRTVQSVMKISPKLKELGLRWDQPIHCETDPASSNWLQKHLESGVPSVSAATETHVWKLEKLRINNLWGYRRSEFELILKLAASTIRELDLQMERYLDVFPQVFPNLRTLRLKHFWFERNFLLRFPNLKFVHIEEKRKSFTLLDYTFTKSMPIIPMVQALSYKGMSDPLPEQCSRIFTVLPNCIKLVIGWYNPRYANNCIRHITRNMTQLKILKVHFRYSDSVVILRELRDHIDDWTFAGLETTPNAPKLERIRIYAYFPEYLSKNILRNVPLRIPSLMSLEIFEELRHHDDDGGDPYYKLYEEFKRNSISSE